MAGLEQVDALRSALQRLRETKMKVAERADLLSKMHELLNMEQVRIALDQASSEEANGGDQRRVFGWRAVIKNMTELVDSERADNEAKRPDDEMKKDSKKKSTTPAYKRDCFTLWRSTIQTALAKRPTNRTKNVSLAAVEGALASLFDADHDLTIGYSSEALDVLVLVLENDSAGLNSMKGNEWRDLFVKCCSLVRTASERPTARIKLSSAAQAVSLLASSLPNSSRALSSDNVQKCCKELQSLFKLLLSMVQRERPVTHLLQALNTLLIRLCIEYRDQLAKLALDIAPSLINLISLWTDDGSDKEYQKLLATFFNFLFVLQQPDCVSVPNVAVLLRSDSEEWSSWKNIVKNLYEHLIAVELSRVLNRAENNQKAKKEPNLMEEQIELIARTVVICHEFGDEISLSLPATSTLMSTTLNNQTRGLDTTASGTANFKRRLIQVGYSFFFDLIIEMATKRRFSNPCYQILSKILSRWGHRLSAEDYDSLIIGLVNSLGQLKRQEAIKWTMRTIAAALPRASKERRLRHLWPTVLDHCLIALRSRTLQSSAATLLIEILKYDTVSDVRHLNLARVLVEVFSMDAPTEHAVEALSAVIGLVDFEEKVEWRSLTAGRRQSPNRSFRLGVVEWLFQVVDEDDLSRESDWVGITALNSVPLDQLTNLISLFCMQYPNYSLSHPESRSCTFALPWNKKEQMLIDAFALSNCNLADQSASSSRPITEALALAEVVSAVIEQFANGSSAVRNAFKTTTNSPRSTTALVRHLNFGLALSGLIDVIGYDDSEQHEDIVALNQEIELLSKLVMDKTLTNASNTVLLETLSTLGKNCSDAPPLRESLLLRLSSLASGDLHQSVGEDSPDENRFVRPNERKRSAPIDRSVERQRNERNDCSIEDIQRAAWECLLRFFNSDDNTEMVVGMLERRASKKIESWMLESVLVTATRPLSSIAKMLLSSEISGSVRERIDALSRARRCCAEVELFEVWAQLWSDIKDGDEQVNKLHLLRSALDVFDTKALRGNQINWVPMTKILLDSGNSDPERLLKLALMADASLLHLNQLRQLLTELSFNTDDQSWPWLKSVTFFRWVAHILADPSTVDLHPNALYHLLVVAQNLPDVWRMFIEQLIPNLTLRIKWNFSIILNSWATGGKHKIYLDKFPVTMVGCANHDVFFERYCDELVGAIVGLSEDDENVKWVRARMAKKTMGERRDVGLRHAVALLCATDVEDRKTALRDFLNYSTNYRDAIQDVWPDILSRLLQWQCRYIDSPEPPQMSEKSVEVAIGRLLAELKKPSLTMALNDGWEMQKNGCNRGASTAGDFLLHLCAQLRATLLDSCGQFSRVLSAFHTLLFELDLKSLNRYYLPFLIREAWWTCAVCIRRSVQEKRQDGSLQLLVHLWTKISERLLSNSRLAIDRLGLAISAVMELFEGEDDYPEASSMAMDNLMKWLRNEKLGEHLTWTAIPIPPIGCVTHELRELLIDKRRLLVQQELTWFTTAEPYLLTVGYWQHLQQLLEKAVAENLKVTVDEQQTGKLLTLWRRRPKWRPRLAPILALLPNDSLLLDQSLLPLMKSIDAFALDWANRLLFATGKSANCRIFDSVRRWLQTTSVVTMFDVEVKKTNAVRCQELLPFRYDKSNLPTQYSSNESDEKLCFMADEWIQPISFEFWMQKAAVGVLREAVAVSERCGGQEAKLLRSFEEFIPQNIDFAQALLPLTCEILIKYQETYRAQLASQFNSILGAMKCASKVEEDAKLPIALTLLEILRHLSSDACRLKSNKLLTLPSVIPLDFALLADVLAAVRLPYAALFYAEIACDEKSESIRATQMFDEAGRSLLDMIEPTSGNELRRTMKNAVLQLRDVDSLKGLGQIAFVDNDARRFLAEQSHSWERMASLYSRADSPAKFSKALRMLGVDDDQAPLTVQYENAWKLGRWEQLDVPKKEASLDARLFGVLNAIKDGNDWLTKRLAGDLLQCNMDQMCQRNIPDISHLRWHRSIVNLQKLALIGKANEKMPEMCRAIDKSLRMENINRPSIAADGNDDELAIEMSILLAKLAKESDVTLKELTFHTLSNTVTARAKALRKSQAYQQSIRLVAEWHELVAAHSDVRLLPAFRLQPALEAASSLRKSDDFALAINQVESIIDELQPKLTPKITTDGVLGNEKLLQVLSKSYALLGKLQSCNGGEQDDALQEACAVLERSSASKGNLATMLSKTNYRVGKYTEAKYRTLRAYRASAEFKAKEDAVEHWKHQMTALTDRFLLHRLRSESRLEKMDIESTDKLLRSLLLECVRRYITAVQHGDSYDLSMYLLIDLWMDNRDNADLCALIRDQATLIPSHKWLLVWNQLSSRVAPLENDCGQLRLVIEKLLGRVAHDHPFHTINSLLYIGEIDTADAKSLSRDKNRSDRVDSAKRILNELKKSDRARVVKDMHDAHQAFRQVTDAPMALFKASKQANGMLDIPASMAILKLAALKNLPIPTLTIPVDKSFKYSDMIRFSEVRPYCSKADGRSVPKVLRVIGSDGVERRIIFKSGDDLRQDILVQQVFAVANSLLTSSKQPGCMRTYNVVPLSHGAGLIEWCDHTMSLCNYLIGPNKSAGAHAKYYPSDITGCAALLKMKKAYEEAEKQPAGRRSTSQHVDPSEAFRSLCEQFHPVFRHFFFERFTHPVEWYRRRSDYTVNVATWSMVCHLVGLGDRHLNNILIDERTAELVHIDLGMAFEFSRRALRVPETVPFRLTRDMLDPMGASGVNGLFTASSARVMTVMRANKSILLAVVSILLHDPVASFQEIPVKKDEKSSQAAKNQPAITNRNGLAETAIARMTEKLSGRETIDKVEMTVDRQVTYLIDEARNPDNLSRMYYGWMPFV